jgi:hypothetical protein
LLLLLLQGGQRRGVGRWGRLERVNAGWLRQCRQMSARGHPPRFVLQLPPRQLAAPATAAAPAGRPIACASDGIAALPVQWLFGAGSGQLRGPGRAERLLRSKSRWVTVRPPIAVARVLAHTLQVGCGVLQALPGPLVVLRCFPRRSSAAKTFFDHGVGKNSSGFACKPLHPPQSTLHSPRRAARTPGVRPACVHPTQRLAARTHQAPLACSWRSSGPRLGSHSASQHRASPGVAQPSVGPSLQRARP